MTEAPLGSTEVASAEREDASQERLRQAHISPAERESDETKKALLKDHVSLVKLLLKSGQDYINRTSIGRITRACWTHVSSISAREKIFENLMTMGMWRQVGRRGQMAEACMPVISTAKSFASVVQTTRPEAIGPLPELFVATQLRGELDRPCHLHNLIKVRDHLQTLISSTSRRGRGRESDTVKAARIAAEKRHASVKCHIQVRETLQNELSSPAFSVAEPPAPSWSSGELMSKGCSYEYKNTLRSRQFVRGAASQSMARVLRDQVLPTGVLDFDLQAAHWSLVLQMGQKMEIALQVPGANLDFIRGYLFLIGLSGRVLNIEIKVFVPHRHVHCMVDVLKQTRKRTKLLPLVWLTSLSITGLGFAVRSVTVDISGGARLC